MCNNCFWHGVDKSNVRFVVHASLPGNGGFLSRNWKSWKRWKPSDTLLIYGFDDFLFVEDLLRKVDVTEEFKIKENKRLDALITYCESTICRNKTLLSYFNEQVKNCGQCDNCLYPPKINKRY